MQGNWSKYFNVLIPITLMFMIMMRLVWLQSRHYVYSTNIRTGTTLSHLVYNHSDYCSLAKEDPLGLLPLSRLVSPPEEHNRHLFSLGFAGYLALACEDGVFNQSLYYKLNMWVLVSTVFLAALMVRMMSGTWLWALIASTILLSRGDYINRVGEISSNVVISFILMSSLVCMSHYLRTGVRKSLVFSLVFLFLGGTFDRVIFIAGLALPGFIITGLILKRFFKPIFDKWQSEILKKRPKEFDLVEHPIFKFLSQVSNYLGFKGSLIPSSADSYVEQEGKQQGILKALKEPFSAWLYEKKRWSHELGRCLIYFLVMAIFLAVIDYFYSLKYLISHLSTYTENTNLTKNFKEWFLQGLEQEVDFHLASSLFILIICMFQHPMKGLLSFFEYSWIIFYCVILVFLGACLFDYLEFQLFLNSVNEQSFFSWYIWRNQQVLKWFEPILLTAGLCGFYNLFKVITPYESH